MPREFQEIEAGEIESDADTMPTPVILVSPAGQAERLGSPGASASAKKWPDNPNSSDNNSSPSVSNCYVFKSRLQEYVQKAGLKTPVYETIKEGPSHEPYFKSTVIVNNVRYDSLPGFYNRKAAEQSAAEIALIELAKSTDMKCGISVPVHETGLCKNLLQEYAQKMNFAVPLYECFKNEKHGRTCTYSCIVDVGGIKYIGGSANTKKEAEIKAARTALLAIQSASASEDRSGNTVYTVIPHKKKAPDLGISTQETAAALAPKKGRFKKQKWKKRRERQYRPKKHVSQDKMNGGSGINTDGGEFGGSDAVSSPHNITNGLVDKMDRKARAGVDVTELVTSESKMAVGSKEGVDVPAGKGLSVTDAVSFQGTDNGLAPMMLPTDSPDTGFHTENLEHNLVPFDEGRYTDLKLTSMDVR